MNKTLFTILILLAFMTTLAGCTAFVYSVGDSNLPDWLKFIFAR